MPEPIQPIVPIEPPVAPVADQPDSDALEWDEVAKEAYPNLLEEKKDPADPADPTKIGESAKPAEPVDPTKPSDPVDPAKPAEPEKPVEAPVDSAVADARATQREIAQEFDTVKRDVALELFKDLPLELRDADGDLIAGVEDVMKLADPRTGVAFTEEAATAWYMQAQQNLNKTIADADEQANRITSVNIGLKDDADKLRREFGDILTANPEVMKTVWDQYTKTLKTSPNGQVVIEAPVSLYEFAKTAISPYATIEKAKADAAAAQEIADKAKRSQERVGRSDIFGSGKTDTMSDDEKEWVDATKDYYGKP